MGFPPILNEIDGFCKKHGITARFVTSAKENINIGILTNSLRVNVVY